MRSWWIVAIVATMLACRKEELVHGEPPGAADASTCSAIVSRYDAIVASGGACGANAECECFNGGISKTTPCGGVTDHASAAKLGALVTDFASSKCHGDMMCAAWQCKPVCESGKCVNSH